jgi:hypothetical protein
MSLIQISPLNINPWQWIAKQTRLWLLGDLPGKLDKLIEDYAEFRLSVEERQAAEARSKIAAFADEIYRGEQHSKDNFEQILEYINFYKDYCDTHRNFRNEITNNSIYLIQDTYKYCLRERKFI